MTMLGIMAEHQGAATLLSARRNHMIVRIVPEQGANRRVLKGGSQAKAASTRAAKPSGDPADFVHRARLQTSVVLASRLGGGAGRRWSGQPNGGGKRGSNKCLFYLKRNFIGHVRLCRGAFPRSLLLYPCS